jgi:hypothetical protein
MMRAQVCVSVQMRDSVEFFLIVFKRSNLYHTSNPQECYKNAAMSSPVCITCVGRVRCFPHVNDAHILFRAIFCPHPQPVHMEFSLRLLFQSSKTRLFSSTHRLMILVITLLHGHSFNHKKLSE